MPSGLKPANYSRVCTRATVLGLVVVSHLLLLSKLPTMSSRFAEPSTEHQERASHLIVMVNIEPTRGPYREKVQGAIKLALLSEPQKTAQRAPGPILSRPLMPPPALALAPAPAAAAQEASVTDHVALDRQGIALVTEGIRTPPPKGVASPPPPLYLDAETLRRAARESRTTLGQMIHASGRVDDQGTSPTERLGLAINSASIPDCIHPDALRRLPVRLGGVLDIPLLVYAAATGKCK